MKIEQNPMSLEVKTINLAYKYRIYPNKEQKRKLHQIFTLRRRYWNTCIAYFDGNYEKKNEKLKTCRSIHAANMIESGWMKSVIPNHRYIDYAYKNVSQAIQKFWDACKSGDRGKAQARYKHNCELTGKKFSIKRYNSFFAPKFQSIHDKQSFTTDIKKGGASLSLKNKTVKIHAKFSPIKIKMSNKDRIFQEEDLQIRSLTFSQDKQQRYYVSIEIKVNRYVQQKEVTNETTVGIDWGVKTFATLSDGTTYDLRDTKRIDVQIKTLQQRLSRMKKKGKNWQKTKLKIAKLHARKSNIRSYDTHQATKDITDRFALVVTEKLNVKGMTKKSKAKKSEDGKGFAPNKKAAKAGLNRAILNKNPFETNRQLKYKSDWKGGSYKQVAAKNTSRECFECGHVSSENRQTQAEFVCVNCGNVDNADFNAAKVIKKRLK